MSEENVVVFVVEKRDEQKRGYYAWDHTLRLVKRDDERVTSIKTDDWNLVELETNPNDRQSPFDEQLLNLNVYQEHSRVVAEDERVATLLAYKILLSKYKDVTGVDFMPSSINMDDWQWVQTVNQFTFDANSADDLVGLLVQFGKDYPLIVALAHQPPVVFPTTKYGTFKDNALFHWVHTKPAHVAQLRSLFVVFSHVFGCCSSSMRPQAIYETLDEAKSHCRKIHNVFACEHFRAVLKGEGGGHCGDPLLNQVCLYRFEYDESEQVYKTNKRMLIQYNIDGAVASDHPGVFCEKCDKEIVKGLRYKCTVCSAYNLCSQCVGGGAIGSHDNMHAFVAMKESASE